MEKAANSSWASLARRSAKNPAFIILEGCTLVCQAGTLHLPDFRSSFWRKKPLDSSENGLPQRGSGPFGRSIVPMLLLPPWGRGLLPVSAQNQPLAPHESPTFRSVVASAM